MTLRSIAPLLLLVLPGCSPEPSGGTATSAPTSLPAASAAPAVSGAPADGSAQPAVGATAAPEAPAVAVAEATNEDPWHPVADVHTHHGTKVLAAAALSDSVAAIVRHQGTAVLLVIDEERARAIWLDTAVQPFALFAENRGQLTVAYTRRDRGGDLHEQRIDLRRMKRLWNEPRRPPEGTPGGARLALPCAGSTHPIHAACLQYVSAEEVLLAVNCHAEGASPASSYAIHDDAFGSPHPAEALQRPFFGCGASIDGHAAISGSTWGATGVFQGERGFRTSAGPIRVSVEGEHLYLLRPGPAGEPPKEIDVERALHRAIEDVHDEVTRRRADLDVEVLRELSEEFPMHADVLAAWVGRLPVGEGVEALRAALGRRPKPSDRVLREDLCPAEGLAATIEAARAAGVTLPCEAPAPAGAAPGETAQAGG